MAYLFVAPTPYIFLLFLLLFPIRSVLLHSRAQPFLTRVLEHAAALLTPEVLRLAGVEEECVFGVGREVGPACWGATRARVCMGVCVRL